MKLSRPIVTLFFALLTQTTSACHQFNQEKESLLIRLQHELDTYQLPLPLRKNIFRIYQDIDTSADPQILIKDALKFTPLPLSTDEQLGGLPEKGFREYCFNPSSQKLGIERIATTPGLYNRTHHDVTAVINGVYYANDQANIPLGVAYNEGIEYANGNINQVRGYFSITRNGKARIIDKKTKNFKKRDYAFLIGTQPLLVENNHVNPQANEKRYYNGSEGIAYRSAIGNKDDHTICFAVTTFPMTMRTWAETLQTHDYRGALNLDGGPVSELSIKSEGKIHDFGPGFTQTQLVVYASKPK